MNEKVEIITVTADNVEEYGFFCCKSKAKSPGYRQKQDWLAQRFTEGLRLKLLCENDRSVGFIEYAPAEAAWRVVNALGYAVIHCIWVVGRAKGKGYGQQLLDACLEDARAAHQHGVVMVASSRTWLAHKQLFLKNGFTMVEQAPPSFELLVKRFADAPLPTFPTDWETRAQRYGAGLSIIYAEQCPYLDDAIKAVVTLASEKGIVARVIKLNSSQELQAQAPSAYGIFNIVYAGKLFSYHYLDNKEQAALSALLEQGA